MTARLILEMTSEIEQGRSVRLSEHGLELATAKEYVRQSQKRLLVTPLLVQLRKVFRGRAEVERNLLSLLDQLRASGTSILMVSHRLEQVFSLADRIVVLRLAHGLRSQELDQILKRNEGR